MIAYRHSIYSFNDGRFRRPANRLPVFTPSERTPTAVDCKDIAREIATMLLSSLSAHFNPFPMLFIIPGFMVQQSLHPSSSSLLDFSF